MLNQEVETTLGTLPVFSPFLLNQILVERIEKTCSRHPEYRPDLRALIFKSVV